MRRSHCAAVASTPRSMTSCSRTPATPSLWSSRPRLSHDDSGKFFSFIVGKDGSNDANTTDQSNANKYLMFYNSKTAIKGVISNNNWGNEQGSKVTVSGNDNSWADYKIVVDGTNLAVFRNNALIIFKANTGIKMSDLGATTAYIGKSFYSVDEYWNGAMDDIKVYRGADLTMPTAVAISGTGVVNNKLTLIEKDSTKLTATVTPDDAVSKNVTWSSSDESVAKVAADGTVTGVKAGTATITATTELGGLKAELPVTVEPMNAKNAAEADLNAAISALKDHHHREPAASCRRAPRMVLRLRGSPLMKSSLPALTPSTRLRRTVWPMPV